MDTKLSIRVRCERWSRLGALLVLCALVISFLGSLALRPSAAAASGLQASAAPTGAWSIGVRKFYVTSLYYDGSQAKGACDDGYHMASLWEILDPSNLQYDTTRGAIQGDSGYGPPSYFGGWVRTGYNSSGANTPGQGNCLAWTNKSGSNYGTAVYLPRDWTAGQDIHVWKTYTTACINLASVWCVEDEAGEHVYLPLVLRDF
jgi:hypothetical protein